MNEPTRDDDEPGPPDRGALSQKSPDAFRTISEVSVDLDVPQHVLRFWEGKFTQIRPLKRGGGRRYYRPDDVELLRGIQHLLYSDGYTIKGVQKLLREHGIKFVVAAGRRGTEDAGPRGKKPVARDYAGRIEPTFASMPAAVAERPPSPATAIPEAQTGSPSASPSAPAVPATRPPAPQPPVMLATANPAAETLDAVDDRPQQAAPASKATETAAVPLSADPADIAPAVLPAPALDMTSPSRALPDSYGDAEEASDDLSPERRATLTALLDRLLAFRGEYDAKRKAAKQRA